MASCKIRLYHFVLFFLVLLTVQTVVIRAQDRPEPQRDLKIKMRDGVTILADLWPPAGNAESYPVILIRTPYGRQYEEGIAKRWCYEGYGVVLNAVRGRDGSEGTWIPWEHELEDGFDTIDWIASKPWCNGKIGMMGGSYLGHTQILAAASGHPALKCIIPISPGSDGFSDVPFSGGIPKLGLLGWLHACRGPILNLNPNYPASANDRSLEVLPVANIDRKWLGYRSEIWQHWSSVEKLSDMPGIGLELWDKLAAVEHKVPVLHIDGLWDHESMATRRNWEQFSKHGGPNQYLIFGPWGHNPNESERISDMNYGRQALVDLRGMRRQWYQHWLGDDAGHELQLPRIQIFATGANRWLHLDRWPAESAKERVWFVRQESSESTRDFAEGLSASPPESDESWEWTFDPKRNIRRNEDLMFYRSTQLWFKHANRDAIILATPEFEQDTLLTGPGELKLVVSSSAEDTDLFALIVEVAADGTVRAIQRQAQLRMRFRDSFDDPKPLTPGEPTSIVLPLGIFAHVFAKGSRLGLAIRSDWFPDAGRNLGTMESNASGTKCVKQVNRLHSSQIQPSSLHVFQTPLDKLQDHDKQDDYPNLSAMSPEARASIAFQMKDWDDASELYQEFIEESESQDPFVRANLSYALFKDKKYAAAIESAKLGAEFPETAAESWMILAQCYARTDQLPEALESLQRAHDAQYCKAAKSVLRDRALRPLWEDVRFQKLAEQFQKMPERRQALVAAGDFEGIRALWYAHSHRWTDEESTIINLIAEDAYSLAAQLDDSSSEVDFESQAKSIRMQAKAADEVFDTESISALVDRVLSWTPEERQLRKEFEKLYGSIGGKIRRHRFDEVIGICDEAAEVATRNGDSYALLLAMKHKALCHTAVMAYNEPRDGVNVDDEWKMGVNAHVEALKLTRELGFIDWQVDEMFGIAQHLQWSSPTPYEKVVEPINESIILRSRLPWGKDGLDRFESVLQSKR